MFLRCAVCDLWSVAVYLSLWFWSRWPWVTEAAGEVEDWLTGLLDRPTVSGHGAGGARAGIRANSTSRWTCWDQPINNSSPLRSVQETNRGLRSTVQSPVKHTV